MGCVMIVCHTCDGKGCIDEIEYETRNVVSCVCPECRGSGYIFVLRCRH